MNSNDPRWKVSSFQIDRATATFLGDAISLFSQAKEKVNASGLALEAVLSSINHELSQMTPNDPYWGPMLKFRDDVKLWGSIFARKNLEGELNTFIVGLQDRQKRFRVR